jgi:ssDNA-binding Zn-finger/Zn-ribbon topoisomerase 1
MLQQMLDHDYLRMMPDGSFRCGESTATLVRVTSCAFPTMKGIQLSAYLAQTIEEAVSGRKPLAFALQQFEQTMRMRGEVLVKMAVPVAGKRRSITSRSVIRLPEEGKSAKLQVSGGEVAPCRVVKEARPAAAETTLSADVERQPLAEEGSEAGVAPTPANEAASEEALLTLSAEEDEPAEGVGGTVEAPKAGSVPGLEEQAVAALAEPAPDPALVAEGIIVGAAAPATSLAEPSSLSAESGIPAMLEPDLAGVESARVCPDCGRVLLLKEDRFGRYWHCSGHPQCRHAESCEKGPGPGLLCPVCRVGTVVTKQTPTGKIFYLCPEQGCAFMAWSTPHAIACPVCASPFLVEKKDPAGGVFLHCPRAGCTHTQALSATGEAGSAPVGAPLKKKVLVRRVAPGSGGGATKKVRIVRRKK